MKSSRVDRCQHNSKHESLGLSLVEVLVAIVILGVVSAAIIALLPGLTRTSTAANEDVVATQQIQSIFERLQAEWAVSTASVWASLASAPSTAVTQVNADLVTAGLGDSCSATAQILEELSVEDSLEPFALSVMVQCEAVGTLPARTLSRAYGVPR